MGYPEDNVSFDDDNLGGMSIEEVAASLFFKPEKPKPPEEVPDIRLVKGKIRVAKKVRRAEPLIAEKVPCIRGSITATDTRARVDEDLKKVHERQDQLAGACLKSINAVERRILTLEAKPTPIWVLGKIQKSCCLLFVGWMVMFGLFCGLGALGRLLELLSK